MNEQRRQRALPSGAHVLLVEVSQQSARGKNKNEEVSETDYLARSATEKMK